MVIRASRDSLQSNFNLKFITAMQNVISEENWSNINNLTHLHSYIIGHYHLLAYSSSEWVLAA